MTLAWIEAQIEETLNGANTAKNVYDLAMLCSARDEMLRRTEPETPEPPEDRSHHDAVVLTAHSANLATVPTLSQIEDALGAVAVHTEDERKRAQDARTWADIIKQK